MSDECFIWLRSDDACYTDHAIRFSLHRLNGFKGKIFRWYSDFLAVASISILALKLPMLSGGDVEAAFASGMDEYISKPFEKELLEETLQKLTG